jgi:T5SS/PEP-CTERM-associated repeat protein
VQFAASARVRVCAVVYINNTTPYSDLNLGGTSVAPGGTGTLNMSGGSTINFTGTAANTSLQVGGSGGTGIMALTGNSVVNMGATGVVLVGANVGSTGTMTIGGGSIVNAVGAVIGGDSTAISGDVFVMNAGSALNINGTAGSVSVGSNGTGSLSILNQGTVSTTVLSVGSGATGLGTLSVDASTLNLSGQQTTGALSGATLTIGTLGGIGSASISNGSIVNITNMGSAGANLNVGGTPGGPLGTGTLNVSNSQINLMAAPGLATTRVGHDGGGTATMTASTLNLGTVTPTGGNGSLIIAGQPGSTGLLSLNAGSVVNAGYVGVGATPGVGGAPSGPAGAGHMILNNSTVNTTSFEIGSQGLLSGDGGVINATGNVTVAGTISPGNSPGRITVNCNLVSLPGSKIILDVQGATGAFNVDHLILGNDSTFNLSNLQIVFNFLGTTDPTSFAASGGFN